MVGIRTVLFGFLATIPLALFAPWPDEPIALDMVQAGANLQVMRYEVSIGLWQRCVADGICTYQPPRGLGATDDTYPVTGIGAIDAAEFVVWAQQHIAPDLRLPTLAEWYAFSEVPPFRPTIIFTDPRMAWAATYGTEETVDPTLKRSGSFGENSKGVADVRGNVWEWTSTCVVTADDGRCPAYFAAGIHEAKIPLFVRDTAAGGCSSGTPPAHLGLRLVRTAD